ncbi:MAG: argininosuccinate lyase [Rickettsiales bacterium]|nr:argininosuccinate lyase [Rickettsiales bacterium]|tara:strand:- start:619 stop:2007 length:1389 start_codon:yes stop_codon:yes gene_type:complete
MKKSINPVWGGRFKKNNSKLLKKINNSISFDYELAFQDVKLNKVYSEALFKAKVISKNEKVKIIKALNEIHQELKNEKFKFSDSYEDIHMNIEMALKRKVGDIAGKVHTGKSRNDQVATDLKMWIKEKLDEIIKRITHIQKTIIKKSEENINIIMPGFTHLQNAQPILFSHYLLSFFEMINRDKIRAMQLIKNLNECPLGSGALAGTNFFEIDRFFIAEQLGFEKPTENSVDSVSDRDYVVEFLTILSLISMHFSKMSEDFIIWSSGAFEFIKFPDSLCTGSSIMPQKKNPDAAELIRSKTGRVFSSLSNLLIIQKGIPSGYSKDLQEDKEPTFDAYYSIEIILNVADEMIKSIKINKERMFQESNKGFTTATDLADWMVKKIGLTFRDAHHKTGRIVLLAEKEKKMLHQLGLNDFKKIEPKINQGVYDVLLPEKSISHKKSYGGTSLKKVGEAIKRAKKRI